MRKLISVVATAAALAATPAGAAEIVQHQGAGTHQAGSFAGLRLRMALGGKEEPGRLRAGLVMAPTLRGDGMDGRSALRFGEGVELGLRDGRPLALTLAGRPLAPGRNVPNGPRAGVSTLGWVAIGVGAVVVLVVAAGVTCQETNCLGSE